MRTRALAAVVSSLVLGVLALGVGGATARVDQSMFNVVCCFKVKIDAAGTYNLSEDNARARGEYHVGWEWSARSIDWLYDFQTGHWALLDTPPQPGASSRAILGGSFRETDGLEYFRSHGSQPAAWEPDASNCDSGKGTLFATPLEKATRSDAGSVRYVVGSQGAEVWAHDFDRVREQCHTNAGFDEFPHTHWAFANLAPPPLAKLRAGDTGRGWLTTTCTRSVYKKIDDVERKAFFVVRVQIRYFPPSQLSAATNGLRKLVDSTDMGSLRSYDDITSGDSGYRGEWPSLLPPDGCHRPN